MRAANAMASLGRQETETSSPSPRHDEVGKERAVAQVRHDDAADQASERFRNDLEKIVRHRTLRLDPFEGQCDGRRFVGADPDREKPLPVRVPATARSGCSSAARYAPLTTSMATASSIASAYHRVGAGYGTRAWPTARKDPGSRVSSERSMTAHNERTLRYQPVQSRP